MKMPFNYKPLWKKLIDEDLTKKMLMEQTGISRSTIEKMNRCDYVSLEVIDRLCNHFECDVNGVIEHEKGI